MDLKGQLEALVARKQNVGWSSLKRPAVNSETSVRSPSTASRQTNPLVVTEHPYSIVTWAGTWTATQLVEPP